MEEEKKSKKKYTKWILFSLSIAVFTVGLGVAIYFKVNYVWTNDAFVEGYATSAGTNVTEAVTRLFVEEGDMVKKGQLLATLHNNIPIARKEAAEATVLSSEQEVLVKEASYLKIRNDYERALQSLKDQIISAQDYDHKQKDFEMAEAELDLARANLDLAKKNLNVVMQELDHYEVFASEDGIVAKRWVWLGDVVQPGQSVYTIYNLDNIWVLANLEEKKIRNVKIGSKVRIHIDAYPGYVFRGEVFAIKGAAASEFSLVPQNTATGNYTKVEQRIPIKISISRPENFPKGKPLYLFPGISASVYIDVKS